MIITLLYLVLSRNIDKHGQGLCSFVYKLNQSFSILFFWYLIFLVLVFLVVNQSIGLMKDYFILISLLSFRGTMHTIYQNQLLLLVIRIVKFKLNILNKKFYSSIQIEITLLLSILICLSGSSWSFLGFLFCFAIKINQIYFIHLFFFFYFFLLF